MRDNWVCRSLLGMHGRCGAPEGCLTPPSILDEGGGRLREVRVCRGFLVAVGCRASGGPQGGATASPVAEEGEGSRSMSRTDRFLAGGMGAGGSGVMLAGSPGCSPAVRRRFAGGATSQSADLGRRTAGRLGTPRGLAGLRVRSQASIALSLSRRARKSCVRTSRMWSCVTVCGVSAAPACMHRDQHPTKRRQSPPEHAGLVTSYC